MNRRGRKCAARRRSDGSDLRGKRARVLASPVGRQTMAMLIANFGMVAGLLGIWAITVNL